jgi:hypothetical protein
VCISQRGCKDSDSKTAPTTKSVYPGPTLMMFLLLHRTNLASRLAFSRSYAKLATGKPYVGLHHLTRQPGKAMEGRQPSPVDGPASKRPRLESPPRTSAPDDTGDVRMDALDAHAAPAVVDGGATSSAKASKKKGRKAKQHAPPEHCSAEDVVARDVAALLGQAAVDAAVDEGSEWDAPFERDARSEKEEVEIEIAALSSNGRSVRLCQLPA